MAHIAFKTLILTIVVSLLIGGCSTTLKPQTSMLTATAVETQTLPSPSATVAFTPTPTPLPPITGLPDNVLPNGLGIALHYMFFPDTYLPGDQNILLARSNIKIIQDNFAIYGLCHNGSCDFSNADSLIAKMNAVGARVTYILGGYTPGTTTEEERKQFAQYAAMAAKHYAGQGVIWQIWTEPDGDFSWQPHSDPQQYASLANEVIPAMREADPNAIIIGPSVSTLTTKYGDNSWMFLKAVGDAGVLSKFDAIDVHLYSGGNPESQISNLLRLRRLIDQYSPDRKIPVTSTEEGYSWGSTRDQFYGRQSTLEEQAKFLARSWLIDHASEINLSVWYDWKDDPWDPTADWAQHFGVITDTGDPKPAFNALQTFTKTFDGYQFVRRLAAPSDHDFLLLFRKGQSGVLAAWTISDFHDITFPGITSSVQSIDLLGNEETLNPDGQGLSVNLTDSPRYVLLPNGSIGNETVFWQPNGTFFRLDSARHGEVPINIQNPSAQKETFQLQATLDGNVIGSITIELDSNETKTVNLPLDIKSTTNQLDFLVEVNLNNQGSQQSAWIWLQK